MKFFNGLKEDMHINDIGENRKNVFNFNVGIKTQFYYSVFMKQQILIILMHYVKEKIGILP